MNHRMKFSAIPLVGVLVLAGCSPERAAEGSLPPPTVTVASPVARDVTDYADFTERTAAVDAVKVRARVWGHLQKINFAEGAEVKKGDLLFVIDRRPYEAAVEKTEAEIAQTEARAK